MKRFLFLCLAVGLTCFLYGRIADLPYFWDDAPHYAMVKNADIGAIWTNSINYSYYRPLIFTLYVLTFDNLPLGETIVPHGIVLFTHAISAVMTGIICGKFWAKQQASKQLVLTAQLLGIALFCVYPFAILTITNYAAAMHSFIVCFALTAVALTFHYHDTGKKWAYVGGVISVFLAPYTHEFGVTIGVIVALAWLLYGWGEMRKHWLVWLIVPLVSSSFLLVWFSIPTPNNTDGGFHTGSVDTIIAKIDFFLQGITYPVQPFANYLIEKQNVWDLVAMSLVAGVALLATGMLLWKEKQIRVLWLAIGWCFIGMSPALLALSFNYIITGPRLLHYPGASGAILWTTVLIALLRSWKRWPIAILLFVGAFVVPFFYVIRITNVHELALTPLAQLSAELKNGRPANQNHLVVNLPYWITHEPNWYPMGHDGATVSVDYVSPQQLMEPNVGRGYQFQGDFATFPELRVIGDQYSLTTMIQTEPLWDRSRFSQLAYKYDTVWLTKYEQNKINLIELGSVSRGDHSSVSFDVIYDNKIGLSSVNRSPDKTAIAFTWHLFGDDFRADATPFRHVFDCNGTMLLNDSSHPMGGMLALDQVEAGTIISERVVFEELAEVDCIDVAVGFFLPDGSRLEAVSADGVLLPDQQYRTGLTTTDAN